MRPVVVVGGSLAGMAAAARLAKAGHEVVLLEAGPGLGGRWAATSLADGTAVDAAPAVIGLPAAWRDLFRKSGRTLDAELARHGYRLAPADPARYRFADGSELPWPTDRASQAATLSTAYGSRVAERWRDLLDRLDDVWQTIRPLGLEGELVGRHQLTRAVRAVLQPRRTVADLARDVDHPQLAAVIRSTAYRQGSPPERTPAWAAVALSVERRFGRWTVTANEPAETEGADARTGPGADRHTGRTSVLLEALAARLAQRKVEVRLDSRVRSIGVEEGRVANVTLADGTEVAAAAVVSTVDPWQLVDRLLPRPAGRQLRRGVQRLSPARAPAVRYRALPEPQSAVSECISLDADGVPMISYRRPAGSASVETVHDFGSARADRSAGVAWNGFRDWLRRPPVSGALPGLYIAGPHTAAGAGLSETLLSGALASYAVHDERTGGAQS